MTAEKVTAGRYSFSSGLRITSIIDCLIVSDRMSSWTCSRVNLVGMRLSDTGYLACTDFRRRGFLLPRLSYDIKGWNMVKLEEKC